MPDWTKTDNIKSFNESKRKRNIRRAASDCLLSVVTHTTPKVVGLHFQKWFNRSDKETQEAIKEAKTTDFPII